MSKTELESWLADIWSRIAYLKGLKDAARKNANRVPFTLDDQLEQGQKREMFLREYISKISA